jgi:drug/metabolite transporter (DMT)-like permease
MIKQAPWYFPFALLFGILAVSTASIFIRYAQGNAPSLVIAAGRLTIASLILAPIALSRYWHEYQTLTRRDLILGILSGFFLALHFATWISSLEYTTVTSSVVLVTTTPLWVALLAPIFLKERITATILIGMTLTLIGGMIIGISDACTIQQGLICPPFSEMISADSFLGNFLALSGAWMAAGYLLIGRSLRSQLSLIPYIFLVYGIAAIVLIVIMLGAGQTLIGYDLDLYLWLAALAIFPQLIGHSTFNWALGYLPAALVSVTLLGEPIGTIALAYFLLNESPSILKLIGGGLILIGIYVTSRRRAN